MLVGSVRVVPSQVVDMIDRLFPHAADAGNLSSTYTFGHAANLRAIAGMVSCVPNSLLPRGERYADLILGVSAIENALAWWTARGDSTTPRPDPLLLIRGALIGLPDDLPPPEFAGLLFIDDRDLAESIGRDLGAAERAMEGSEHKVAVVMAGAATEALLLWALSRDPVAVESARQALISAGKWRLDVKKKPHLDDWDLWHYMLSAAHLDIIDPQTAAAVDLAREYRNLIYPGRVRRLSAKSDRAAALATLSGAFHVVRNLSELPTFHKRP